MCELLKSKGARFDTLRDYPLADPTLFGYQPENASHLKTPCEDYQKAMANTRISPLILAIYCRDFDTVKYMLQNGASVNFADDQKRTPLMHAVRAVRQNCYVGVTLQSYLIV